MGEILQRKLVHVKEMLYLTARGSMSDKGCLQVKVGACQRNPSSHCKGSMSGKGCLQVQCNKEKHIRMYEIMKAWNVLSRSQAPSLFEYAGLCRKIYESSGIS